MNLPITETEWVCEECGSDGEDGAIMTASGKVWHLRKFPEGPLTKPLPILCYGKFKRRGKA